MAITSVTYTIKGQAYTLTYNASTGKYQTTITAPAGTSWYEPEHQFAGTLTAINRDGLGVVNTVTQRVGLRVLEQDAPVIAAREPADLALVLTLTPEVEWFCADGGSGIDTETVSFRVDGVEQEGITITPAGNGYLCRCTPEMSQGVHTLSFDVSDNDGNAAQTASVTVAVYLLITDRTAEDAARARYLNKVVNAKLATPEEIAEYTGDLKGAYNASDMNRVGTAVWFLHLLLERYGYATNVAANRDWAKDSIPTPEQREAYLADVRAIRGAVAVPDTTPEVPEDMQNFLWNEANDIEQILYNVNCAIARLLPAQIYSGEFDAGEE